MWKTPTCGSACALCGHGSVRSRIFKGRAFSTVEGVVDTSRGSRSLLWRELQTARFQFMFWISPRCRKNVYFLLWKSSSPIQFLLKSDHSIPETLMMLQSEAFDILRSHDETGLVCIKMCHRPKCATCWGCLTLEWQDALLTPSTSFTQRTFVWSSSRGACHPDLCLKTHNINMMHGFLVFHIWRLKRRSCV